MSDGYAGLAACVHCGFCLPACPTYGATGDEADGPRGRIVLMRGLAAGTLAPTDHAVTTHLDRCLGCRACEPVCPSGVRYGEALEAARADLDMVNGTPWIVRLVLFIMAAAPVRRLVLGLARLLRPVAGWFAGWSRPAFAAGMLAGSRGLTPPRALRAHVAPVAPVAPAVAALFLGCVQRELFAQVHDASQLTLSVNGFAATAPERQTCCGALHAHAGRHAEAQRLARANVRAFRDTAGPIVVNSAGCGAMLKDYGRLLADEPLAQDARAVAARVRDITEVLADAGPVPGAHMPLRVAYDAPCHLQHAQGVTAPPLAVLAAIPGLELVPHAGADRCCGGAGVYGLVQPRLSRDVLQPKLRALIAADVDVVTTGNPGCQMQIAAGLAAEGRAMPVCHPVELLAASYRLGGLHS